MDLRIRGGASVDATGAPALAGDVEIEAGRIVQRAMGIERVLVDDGTHNDTRAGPPLARG